MRRSSRTLSMSAVIAMVGTRRPFPSRTHGRSSGPSLRPGLCCPTGSSGTTAASDSLPARRPLHGSSPLMGHEAPALLISAIAGPRRASPVPAITFRTFRALYAGEFLRVEIQVLHPFRGLRPEGLGSALPAPASRRATLTARQASLDAADRSVASPSQGS